MKKIIQYISTIIICTTILSMIICSKEAKAGYLEGLKLCANIIVPALLPILILTNALVSSKGSILFEKMFGRLTQQILHLPKEATTAIIFGLIGGYPAGALLTNQLLNDGIITKETARKMLGFNFCGGIAFIITAVGSERLKSIKLGIAIFVINVISNIVIAVVENRKSNVQEIEVYNEKLSFSNALVVSVENSTKSIIIMCGYILLFSAIIKLVPIPSYLSPIIEITNGIFKSNTQPSFSYLCFFLSFGGFCIHLQLLGAMKNADMKYINFLIHRLCSATISYFLGKVYEYLFPTNLEVFSNMSSITPRATQTNSALSIVLLISCVVIVVDLNNKKSKLI